MSLSFKVYWLQLGWIKGLWISFASSYFLFPYRVESKRFEDWGVKKCLDWGVSTPLHTMSIGCKGRFANSKTERFRKKDNFLTSNTREIETKHLQ